jgi:hypothetical protein
MDPGTGRRKYYSVGTVGYESRVIEDGRIPLIDHDSMKANLPSLLGGDSESVGTWTRERN